MIIAIITFVLLGVLLFVFDDSEEYRTTFIEIDFSKRKNS